MRQVAGSSRGGEEDYIFSYRMKGGGRVAAIIKLEIQDINVTHTQIINKSITLNL